jgi:Zn-dependent protease
MSDIFFFIILIFSVVIHEVSHGWAAKVQGDDTAEMMGRLSLNPIRHIDPVGSVLLPLSLFLFSRLTGGPGIIFGWAKPVPYVPWRLRDQRWGPALVALAGPASNFTLAILFGLLVRFFGGSGISPAIQLFAIIVWVNIFLGTFNLVPIPPLDGSKLFAGLAPRFWGQIEWFMIQYGLFLFFFLILFGFQFLIPLMIFLFRLFTGIPSPPF